MFRGGSEISMDGKGRIAMSARHRDELMARCSGRIVITIDDVHRCLFIYPEPEWEAVEAPIAAMPASDPKARRLQHLRIGHARELVLDNTGRVLIPPELRTYAGLVKDLKLVGTGKYLELWDLKTWETQFEKWLSEPAAAEAAPSEEQQVPLPNEKQ